MTLRPLLLALPFGLLLPGLAGCGGSSEEKGLILAISRFDGRPLPAR